MQKIFITCFQPFVSRNILNSGVLDGLLNKKCKIYLFVPIAKEEYFRKNFKTVTVIGIDTPIQLGRKERLLKAFSDLSLDTNTKRFHKLIEYENGKNIFKYILKSVATKTISHVPGTRKMYRYTDYHLGNKDFFNKYFDKYKPDIVFATNIYGDEDVAMVREAKSRSIKTVGMVLSWDNNTSKTLQRIIPDIQIVQNEVIAEESQRLHSVPEEIIRISGIPHYDMYLNYKPSVLREVFFADMGLDPNKKTILISPAGEKFIDSDSQILNIIKDGYNKGLIEKNVQFLVRLHPTNKVNLSDFVADNNFAIDIPGVSFTGIRSKDNELDSKSLDHLKNSLYFSDVVINTLSSMAIDAAVFNKPIITIGFNGYDNPRFYRSVQLFLEEENMAKLLSVGAMPVVKNKDELIEWINKYIKNKDLLENERRQLVNQQCWRLDNKSKDRIVEYVLE